MYNLDPAPLPKPMEGKKTKFDAAEYDESFLERFAAMDWEDFRLYLQTLPEAERKAIMDALSRSSCQAIVRDHHEWLRGGV